MHNYFAVQEIAGKPMTSDQLYRSVIECADIVYAAQVFDGINHAKLQREGDVIVMYGTSGVHRLSVKATDAERLHAHWQGFKEGAVAETRIVLKKGA